MPTTRPNSVSPLIEPNEVPIVIAVLECLLRLTRFEQWTPMAMGLARRCWRGGNERGGREELKDMRQVALTELWSATRDYDPLHGTEFSTFAHKYISNRLKFDYQVEPRSVQAKALSTDWTPPDRNADDPADIRDLDPDAPTFSDDMERVLGYLEKRNEHVMRRLAEDPTWDSELDQPTVADIAKELGISEARVNQIKKESIAQLANYLGDPEPLRLLREGTSGYAGRYGPTKYKVRPDHGAINFEEAG